MSIFVSVVAYRDPVLEYTIQRARDTARDPDGLYFGVVEQAESSRLTGDTYLRVDPRQARGPCWVRSIAQAFYRGQDWYLQLDSHMDFDAGWDEKMIAWARELGPRAVYTGYPPPFTLVENHAVKTPIAGVMGCVVKPKASFAADHYALDFTDEDVPGATTPVRGFHLAAGCLFATGRFATEFPYDPAMYFKGEEQALALRLFTHGWDIFHPPSIPIYHLYNVERADIGGRPMHWDDDPRWAAMEAASLARLTSLISGAPLGIYGLGAKRSIQDFAAFSGIDYVNRRIEPRAYCAAKCDVDRLSSARCAAL